MNLKDCKQKPSLPKVRLFAHGRRTLQPNATISINNSPPQMPHADLKNDYRHR